MKIFFLVLALNYWEKLIVICIFQPDIKEQVFQSLFYFLENGNFDIQYFTLQAIGSMCIRHYDYMLAPELKNMYHLLLTDPGAHIAMRIQVLNNIETYLQEEEMRMIKQDQECKHNSHANVSHRQLTHLILLQGPSCLKRRISKKWETLVLEWPVRSSRFI